jgi:hypothetical protein
MLCRTSFINSATERYVNFAGNVLCLDRHVRLYLRVQEGL